MKPFDLEELFARGKALLRRGIQGNFFRFNDIVVDLQKKEVRKTPSITSPDKNEPSVVIHLTLKEFQILELLIKNKGRALSRTDIITELWGDVAIWEADNKLDVYISTLRKKLGKDIITTVKGF